ncbi:hypothetical protein CHS0354_026420 [Potamilus streckersoni]|uniref:Uncharacterized protein n=1 Tax=Potamilus streckersoni TaxID=2493646 RepID=A0AAE0T3Z4_9BIVA|nr:hypothetical protein CHS0354_026420 [Potamilus streckersoni]
MECVIYTNYNTGEYVAWFSLNELSSHILRNHEKIEKRKTQHPEKLKQKVSTGSESGGDVSTRWIIRRSFISDGTGD